HNPETYIGMLTEEILEANPYVSALEATCRELRRTKNFPPSIAEVLEELSKQHEDTWEWVLREIQEKDIDESVQKRTRLIEAAEAKAAKEAEEKRLKEEREAREYDEALARWGPEGMDSWVGGKEAAGKLSATIKMKHNEMKHNEMKRRAQEQLLA